MHRVEDEVAAVGKTVEILEKARDMLDKHYQWCDLEYNGEYNEVGGEARKRVSQLIWIMREVQKIVLRTVPFRVITDQKPPFPADKKAQKEWFKSMEAPEILSAHEAVLSITEPLEFFTEAFYWFAARVRSVIQSLPRLESFEAEGVRNVRNHLLEHPEKKSSGVLINSFGYGWKQGPVIKALRYDHQRTVWPDAGLFVNASEFSEKLIQCVNAAFA